MSADLHAAIEKALDDELCTCEQCEDGDKYNDGVRSVQKAIREVLAAHPAEPVLLDQQAVATVVYAAVRKHAGPVAASFVGTDVLGPLMELARPMPTPEAIEQRVRRIYIDGGAHIAHAQEAAAEIASAVLSLLRGDQP